MVDRGLHRPLDHWREGKPEVIVLATDWSARGDRPLDRAIQLAHYWGAWLIIFTVVETVPPDTHWSTLEAEIKARIFEEMPSRDVRFHIDVGRGDVASQVLEIAAEMRADLIVTGVARRDHVGDYLLGTSVDALVRRTATPLLVVKSRPRNGYARIMATTDYTHCSIHTLDVMPAFPRAEATLVHAYRPPVATILTGDVATAPVPETELAERKSFLDMLNPELRSRLETTSIGGLPWEALSAAVRDRRFDLAVVERHGGNSIGRALLGGMAQKLLGALPCDVLVVPHPG